MTGENWKTDSGYIQNLDLNKVRGKRRRTGKEEKRDSGCGVVWWPEAGKGEVNFADEFQSLLKFFQPPRASWPSLWEMLLNGFMWSTNPDSFGSQTLSLDQFKSQAIRAELGIQLSSGSSPPPPSEVPFLFSSCPWDSEWLEQLAKPTLGILCKYALKRDGAFLSCPTWGRRPWQI